jgi:hypothetical protein
MLHASFESIPFRVFFYSLIFLINSNCFISAQSNPLNSRISLAPHSLTAQQQQSIQTDPSTLNDLPLTIVNNLLRKCSGLATLEQCDMCSLCQNGALCRQNPKKTVAVPTSTSKRLPFPQKTTTQATPMLALSTATYKTSFDSLALLKSLIDFTCYCVPGYTGNYCQIDVNECLAMPCSVNATCIDRINSYECKCPAGFTGDSCEINVNECETAPCQPEGGVCIDLVDGYYCQCHPGFTGPTCSINVDECAINPCANNATCIDLVNG